MDITDIMSSEFHWAKLALGVTIGVAVNAFFVACYFRKKKKENDSSKHDIEIVPPLEDDTLGVIDRYEKLHSYTTGNTNSSNTTDNEAGANLDILEQQLFENLQGANLVKPDQQLTQRKGENVNRLENADSQNPGKADANLAGAIREQVHRCHTAIVHLQNRLQNENSKRQQAEEWCSMLEKELTAHLAARQTAETKCEKLHQKIKLQSRKLKLQERILRKRRNDEASRQKNHHHRDSQNNQNGFDQQQQQQQQNHVHNGNNRYDEFVAEPEIHVTVTAPSGGTEEYLEEEEEEFCDDYTDLYTRYPDNDDEPHFASDLDEDKIVEPQELQKIIEAVDEVSDGEDETEEDESDLESEQEEPRIDYDDLNDLLQGMDDTDDNLSDILAANVDDDLREDDEHSMGDVVDAPTEDKEGDISAESIGDTKSTRSFWEQKAIEQEEESQETTKSPAIHSQLDKIKKSVLVRRGGSFRDPPKATKAPILKPSGKQYSQEAETVQTQSMMSDSLQNSGCVKEGSKLGIGAMREHWEKNQRKWGSSHVINAKHDGSNGSDEDSGSENGNTDALAELKRSTNFGDLKDKWIKKHEKERLGRAEVSTDINENTKIQRDDRDPGFKALKEEWESKTQEQDESL